MTKAKNHVLYPHRIPELPRPDRPKACRYCGTMTRRANRVCESCRDLPANDPHSGAWRP